MPTAGNVLRVGSLRVPRRTTWGNTRCLSVLTSSIVRHRAKTNGTTNHWGPSILLTVGIWLLLGPEQATDTGTLHHCTTSSFTSGHVGYLPPSECDINLGAHIFEPPIQWVPEALSLRVKRPGRETNHLPLSSAEDKNAWSYTSTSSYVIMAWCLVKHRDNFTLPTNSFLEMLHIQTWQ